MKCPSCGGNHKKKEGRVCSCGYHFVFSPDQDKGMTDGRFTAHVNAVSREGTYYFTKNQLYSVCLRKSDKAVPVGCLAFGITWVITAIFFLDWFNVFYLGAFKFFLGAALIIAVVILLAPLFKKNIPLSMEDFDRYVHRWQSAGHKLDKYILKPRLHTPPPEWQEPDIYQYGVERILIVERDIMVDALVLNGFHAQERALIVSNNGYPEYLIPRVKDIVKNSPNIDVFYIHDVPAENSKVYGLGRAKALVGGRPVKDIGFFADDIKKIKSLKQLSPEAFRGRIPADAMTYAGLSALAVACFSEGLAIHEALARTDAHDTGSSGGYG